MVRFCSGLRKLADGGAEVDDPPRLSRSHRRIGKIELRLVALRLGLARGLRPRCCVAPSSASTCRCDSFSVAWALAREACCCLSCELYCWAFWMLPEPFLREFLIARVLLLREHQHRLRLVHLRRVGADLRLLHLELRVDVLDAGLRRRHLRLGLVERGAVIAVVDAEQSRRLWRRARYR